MWRRDVLVTMLTALLLSLFPWLRTDEGVVVAGKAAEAMAEGLTTKQILTMLRKDVAVVQGWVGKEFAQPFSVDRDDSQGGYMFHHHDGERGHMAFMSDASLSILTEDDNVRRKVVQRAMTLASDGEFRRPANRALREAHRRTGWKVILA